MSKSLLLLLAIISLYFQLISLSKETSNLRNLGFTQNIAKAYSLAKFDFLGQSISIDEKISVKGGQLSNQIIFKTKSVSIVFGFNGITSPCSKSF